MPERVLITGGAGYIGALACDELLQAGMQVRAVDVLLHGQEDIAAAIESQGVELIRADLRDDDARAKALEGARRSRPPRGDRRRPGLRAGSRALPRGQRRGNAQARRRRRQGRRRALRVRVDMLELRPHVRPDRADHRGRRARPGVAICRAEGRNGAGAAPRRPRSINPTCLRFATVYGVAPRMRFDLTVNEFTRDLWADRDLEVFGEQFWRPYIHVRDAARAVRTVLQAISATSSPARSSMPAARARTTASSTSSSRSAEQTDNGNVNYVQARRGSRATTRSASTRSAPCSASRR